MLRTFALIVAADQHRAAASIARGIDNRAGHQPDFVTKHLDRAAGLARFAPGNVEGAGDQGDSV